ncbi:virulence factor family protein [Mariprofundus ferrooxydans]|uniref:virulence factor family protein n=1 Tax=Mariprofundus ferrooxydans TaxID=314344 RepID=UPI001431670A|nr:virulence factor family protein [Mariprofundus ferrooxydans]
MRFKIYVMAACMAGICYAAMPANAEETLDYGAFGVLHLYQQPNQTPDRVVLFFSGDGGWNLGVVDMAKALAGTGAMVIGIDTPHYLKRIGHGKAACSYPAGDIESLSQYIQKRSNLKRYYAPVLVGYSSGATLVYAAIAQAPASTFAGAISLGFAPDLPLSKPFCRGAGLMADKLPKNKGYSFKPVTKVSRPWIVLQGDIDQVFDPAQADAFVSRVAGAKIVRLPHVGHGFSVQRNWMPQFTQAYTEIQQQSLTREQQSRVNRRDVTHPENFDLPVIEVPAQTDHPSDELVVMLSGDGGWASIDREVGQALASQGVAVVGLNSLRYFWEARTPQQSAVDVGKIISRYLDIWHKKRVILIGYSFGADVASFIYNRLTPDIRKQVHSLVLLEPGSKAFFEFTLDHWLHENDGGYPVLPEIKRVQGRLLCIYAGGSERNSPCVRIPADQPRLQTLRLPGGHHFNGQYQHLAAEILRNIRTHA